VLWARENLLEFEVVFCDTGWEHPITYGYINYIKENLLGGELTVLNSGKYESFEELCVKKKRVPSTMARFCTEELKINPTKEYLIRYLPDVEIYTGVRADESLARRNLPERAFADVYGCDMVRPLIKWTAEECFAIMKRYDVEPNPLYKMGMKELVVCPALWLG